MVPIEPILEDIKQKFGTADVRLPGYGEIEPLVVSSEVSKTLPMVEKGGQTPGSEGRSTSKPAAVSNNLHARWQSTELPSRTDCHASSQREDLIIDEKYSMLESTPETSMATQTVPRSEPTGSIIEVNRLLTDHPSSSSGPISEVEQGRPVSHPLSSRPISPRHPGLKSSVPHRFLVYLRPLQKIYTASCMLWRRFERWSLRTEYRRRQRRKRGRGTKQMLESFLCLWNFCVYDNTQTTMASGLRIAWYCIRLSSYALGNAVLSFLYFVACFPCSVWVRNRHRDVFQDEETLARRRHESMEMLGPLPREFDDHRLMERFMRYDVDTYSRIAVVGPPP